MRVIVTIIAMLLASSCTTMENIRDRPSIEYHGEGLLYYDPLAPRGRQAFERLAWQVPISERERSALLRVAHSQRLQWIVRCSVDNDNRPRNCEIEGAHPDSSAVRRAILGQMREAPAITPENRQGREVSHLLAEFILYSSDFRDPFWEPPCIVLAFCAYIHTPENFSPPPPPPPVSSSGGS